MQTINKNEQGENTGLTKGSRTVFPIALIIKILLIILGSILLLGIIYQFLLKGNYHKDEIPSTAQDTGEFFPSDKIYNPTSITPWDHADDTLVPAPVLPSLGELHSLYERVVKAVETRNYHEINNLLSGERIWYMNNPKKPAGQTREGDMVFIRDVEENTDRAPEILFGIPIWADLIPVSVSEGKINSLQEFILLDEETGFSQIVEMTPWKYVAKVSYTTGENAINKGQGIVTFVYDKGEWRYHGGSWELQERNEGFSFGDKIAPSVKTHKIVPTSEGVNTPNIKVGIGEAVIWQGVRGIIYTTASFTQDHFNSPYLITKDKFAIIFEREGDYYYLIKNNQGEVRGEIHVN